MDNTEEIKNLGSLVLSEVADQVSREEYIDISTKMQKNMVLLNIRVKDLSESIEGYERINNKYWHLIRLLTDCTAQNFTVERAKQILTDLTK